MNKLVKWVIGALAIAAFIGIVGIASASDKSKHGASNPTGEKEMVLTQAVASSSGKEEGDGGHAGHTEKKDAGEHGTKEGQPSNTNSSVQSPSTTTNHSTKIQTLLDTAF